MPMMLLIIGVLALLGCKGQADSSVARPILEVQVVEATLQTVPDEPELIGQAEASSIVEIRPQVTGIIKQRLFSEGRDVKAGDRLYEIDPVPFKAAFASAQTDLLTVIHQVDPMYVIVSAPESFLLKRRRDILSQRIEHPGIYSLTGTLIFVDGTVYPHEGKLDFADISLRTETGSRQARVVFPNPGRVLLPGQFVTVRFHGVSKPNAILVPQRAVQQGPKGAVVYVVGLDEKLEVRDVKATDWRGDRWRIEQGLHAGERVMVDGFQRAVPGAPVKAVLVSSAMAEPAPVLGGVGAEQAK